MKLNEGVIHKVVIAQKFYKLFRRQVISDIGKTYSRGDSGNAANSTEKRRFPNTKGLSTFQHIAGSVVFRKKERTVRIVPDPIPDSIVETDCFCNRIVIHIFQ